MIRRPSMRHWLITTTALAGVFPLIGLTASTAHANPQGGTVAQGSATITQTDPKTVTVNQTSDRAVLNWQSFSIGAGETTRFNQPSSSSMTLNRVTGDQVSQILGNLQANGRVYLVNPNGIVFGAGSKIDVAALVASTANIKDSNFMAGTLRFDIPGRANAQIINEGTITAQDGGLVALIAPSLRNSGIIQARLGRVALAAANGVTLDLYGDNLILFQTSDKITQQVVGADGQPVSALVENSGKIYADGGTVLMTANAAKGVVDNVINTTGLVSARAVEQQGGEIVLKGEEGGIVQVAGALDASAPNGGDGGFIETSGEKVTISPSARISTIAPFGKTGRWLIDPTDYVIAASGGDITSGQLATYLNATDIEIQTAATGVENGDIHVNQGISWTSANKLTLRAYRHIFVNELINAAGGGSIKLRADDTGQGVGTIEFAGNGRVIANNSAAVGIFYNPTSYTDAATKSDASGNPYTSYVTLNNASSLTAYMLVNDINALQSIQGNLSGNYAIGKNIDATATATWDGGLGFQPIGYTDYGNYYESGQHPFTGKLNGNGNSISHIYINRPSQTKVGLIGELTGIVSDIVLDGGDVTGNEAVGGLVGLNRGNVKNSQSSANIVGMRYMGGLVGVNKSTSSGFYNGQFFLTNPAIVENSQSSARVVASSGGINAGGLVGYNLGIIRDSHATGDVNATDSAWNGGTGGLVGMDEGQVSRSYATGNVSGLDYVGGLIGIGAYGGLENSYATGNVTGRQHVGALIGFNEGSVLNSYATGAVSGSLNVGGLGGTDSSPPYYYWTTTNSYWDVNTTGRSSSAGGTGKTTSELKQRNTYAGWDFSTVWQIDEGNAYPTLRQPSRPSSLTLTPGVTITQSTVTMFNRYRNADAVTLLSGIFAGDLRNDPTDAVWHALYQHGRATAAQVEANRMWSVYDTYKNADAATLAAGLRSGAFTSSSADPVWQALAVNMNRQAALNILAGHSTSTEKTTTTPPDAPMRQGPYNPLPIILPSPVKNYQDSISVKFLSSLPMFSHALGPQGLNVSMLSMEEKRVLAGSLSMNGISLSFSEFGQLGEDFRNKTQKVNDDWGVKMAAALKKISDADSVSAQQWVEIVVNGAINMTTSVVDVVTAGGGTQIRAAQKLPSLVKTLKGLQVVDGGYEVTLAVRKAVEILDSPASKVGTLLLQSGFTVTNEIKDIISKEEAGADALKNSGVLVSDLAVGTVLDATSAGRISKMMAGKIAQAVVAVGTVAATSDSPEIRELLETAFEFTPWAGPILAQYNATNKILSQSTPEAKEAYKEFLSIQAQFHRESDALYQDTLTQRLQITINAANAYGNNFGVIGGGIPGL